jgi:2-isopropylmalate synthase
LNNTDKIYLYDTLLRDGSQTQGVNFSLNDKLRLTKAIDELGIDYIEGGFLGANPTDDDYFKHLPKTKNSKLTAFGMTAKPNLKPSEDKGLKNLAESEVKAVCIVGKSWDFHVKEALGITLKENLKLIENSIKFLAKTGKEVLFDAEHFFDGYKHNKEHAIEVIKTAYNAGANWVVLCDTNGGTLPFEVGEITEKVTKFIKGKHIGIHCHNDTENAIANSIEAVRAGARQVQGTINGYGERCGNTNLIALIPTLKYKMGLDISVTDEQVKHLKKTSDELDEILNLNHYRHGAYVGNSAFAHKGGLHASAVNKNPDAYEHINPEKIGNKRIIVISDKAGRSNISARLKNLNIKATKEQIEEIVATVKQRESEGYAYDFADASFEVLVHNVLNKGKNFYEVKSFRIIDERRKNAKGQLINIAEATVKVVIDEKEYIEISEGSGPVDALARAIKKAVSKKYKAVNDVALIDYKVRIMQAEKGTGAITRVLIESRDSKSNNFITIGVSSNILDASFNALNDSLVYKIIKC